MQPAETRTGSIYDLGYRNYEGVRRGRVHAIMSLFWYTLRGCFGLGRRTSSKIIPVIITVIAFLPAVFQLGVAALFTEEAEIFEPEDYFGFIQIPIALFCAAVAPDVAGRDMRQRTLALYFSRALRRSDYAIAKSTAFASALLVLTLAPQLVLVVGNGLAGSDVPGYIADNWADFPRTVAAGVLIAAMAAAVSLAIASQTSRRAYATVAVIAWWVVLGFVSNVLAFTIGGVGELAIYLSGFDVGFEATQFIFGAGSDSGTEEISYATWTYFVAALAYVAGGLALVVRRFQQVAA